MLNEPYTDGTTALAKPLYVTSSILTSNGSVGNPEAIPDSPRISQYAGCGSGSVFATAAP